VGRGNQERNKRRKSYYTKDKKGYKKIAIVGLTGKRFDHTLNNLSILKKYSGKADIKVYDNNFEYYFIKKNTEFKYNVGDIISLLALPKASGITTSGLKYPLKNGTLEFGGMQGSLNTAISKNVRIEIKKGHLLIFKKHFGNIE